MGLNVELVSQFAKYTANKKETKKESTAWGEVVEITASGKTFVKLDGSDRVTPVETLTEAKVGDRVSVTIKNHAATLTGNASSPSINADGSTIGGIRNDFKNLSADNLLIREKLTASEGYIAELSAKNVKIEETLEAHTGKFENLEADVAEFERLSATFATFDALNAKDAEIRNLLTDYATIEKLNADRAEIDDLLAGKATIADLSAVQAKVGLLDADVADINTLMFGSASGSSIHTSFANAVIAQLGDAQIKSAMIKDISAGKITSGDIITDNVKVKSNDGKLLIADQTIQISDSTRVRVQIGKDAANDYSINIWDANGKLMFSEGGLTEDAVKEQIIRNDMVKDDANISASKLDINTLFNVINEDGSHTLKSNKIKLDEQNQTLDVAFGALTTKVNGQSETISSQGTAISVIQGNISSKIWQQDIASAIDDISIGGRNMLLNTGRDGSIKLAGGAYATYLATITSVTNNGGELALECSATDAEIYYRFMTPKTDDLYGLEPGKSYTFSGKAKVVTTSGTLDALRARSQDYIGGWSGGGGVDILTADTDEWVDFASTFTIRENATGVYISVQLYYTGSWSGTIYLKDLKFEQGNIATAWTAAPEDIEKDISNLSTQYSTLDQTIDSISATVGKHTTDIAKKADGTVVTSLSNQVSDLVVDLEGFRTTVSETYTTKTDFANLSIGGRNLIAKTSIDTVYSGVKPTDRTSKDVWSAQTIAAPTENEYVVSFDAKADENIEISCFFYMPNTTLTSESSTGDKRINATDGVSKVAITTEWKRYWVKWTQDGSSTTTIKSVIVGRNFSETNRVYIRAVKLEVGNKPTDWSPAPEDMATTNDINVLSTSINQTKDSIDLCATKAEFEYVTGQFTDAVTAISDDLYNLYSNGRNLLRNTGGGGDVVIAYGNTTAAVQNITARTNENGIQTLTASATNKEIYYRFMKVENTNLHGLMPGETYTFSGKVRITTTSGSFGSLKVRSQHYTSATGWKGDYDNGFDILESVAKISTVDWLDFSKTFTIPENAIGYYLSFQMYYPGDLISEGSWAGTIEFKELQLEKGDKRTSWSLAPEDISGYYSKTQTDAQIKIASDSITQTVSETYATKNSLTSAVSEIHQTSDSIMLSVEKISRTGRNLARGTSQKDTEIGGYPTSGYNEGPFTGKTTIVPSGNEYVASFEAKSTVNDDAIHCYFYSPNTTTKSLSSTGSGSSSSDGLCVIRLTTEWKRYWVKWTQEGAATTSQKNYIIGRRMAGTGSGTVSIRCVKLEEGHDPTPWSAAPEDARSNFANDSSNVTITNGAITFETGTLLINAGNFTLDANGNITATNATLEGTVNTIYNKQKATLTSGELTFYYDDRKQGLISSKYHPNAIEYGLTLRLPSIYENSLTSITFVHEVGDEGSGYVVDYEMTNFESTGVTSGFLTDDGYFPRHTFWGGMSILNGLFVSGEIYPSGMIYLRNQCAIGWYDKDKGGPQQLISFDNANAFTAGSKSYNTVIYGNYIDFNAKSEIAFANGVEKLVLAGLSSIGTYSGYFYSVNSGTCCLGKSANRWYRLYAVNECSISSDRRLKENIESLSDIHSSLFDKLQPVQYNFIQGDGRTHYGLIAQDVISAMAELGIDENDLDLVQHDIDVNETGELNDTYGMAYGNIIPMLIHEVQKLKREIKTLKGE